MPGSTDELRPCYEMPFHFERIMRSLPAQKSVGLYLFILTKSEGERETSNE